MSLHYKSESSRAGGRRTRPGFPEDETLSRNFPGTPIRHRGAQFGNFFLGDKESGREFTREDEEVLALFAAQAGAAIARGGDGSRGGGGPRDAGRPQSQHADRVEVALRNRAGPARPGRVSTLDYLLRRVWRSRCGGNPRIVRVYIKRLRDKLGDDPRNPTYVFTEPRAGNRLPRPEDG